MASSLCLGVFVVHSVYSVCSVVKTQERVCESEGGSFNAEGAEDAENRGERKTGGLYPVFIRVIRG